MIPRLVGFLAALLMASPALAEPIYCEATVRISDGWLSATVLPSDGGAKPMLRWRHGDRETGEVTLTYLGEPADLRLERISVTVDKSGGRAAANRLHRAREGQFVAGLGEQQWRSYWHDWRRWDDPSWIAAGELKIADAPATVGGPLRLTLLKGVGTPVHALTMTTPGGPDLANAATDVLRRARDGLKMGEGCFNREVEVSEVI